MEHLHHFDLSQDPFQNEPDLRFYFASAYHRDVQLRIDRGLRQRKGLCVLTGEGGTGKTLLARRILDTLEEEVFDANLMVMLPGAADAESVLSRFARQVGVESPSSDRSALLAQVYEQLAIVREDGRHCVLILDDAQILKRAAVAEICGLLNLEYEDRRLLSLLLVGLPDLDVTISHDASLGQRVDVRVQLQPLDLDNSGAYLRHRLSVAGGRAEILPSEAIDLLHKFGRGRPRLMNTLADNALFEAYLAKSPFVTGANVEQAAADLGVGLDPGETYQSMPGPRTPSADLPLEPASPPDPVVSDAPALRPTSAQATMVIEPEALEAAMANARRKAAPEPSVAEPDDGDLGFASLLEDDGEGDELAMLSPESPLDGGFGAPHDLDREIPRGVETTRITLLDDALLDAPLDAELDDRSDDAIDDLFVELIEE